jgi:glycosyltransferase involved in cell wall biosynthesis
VAEAIESALAQTWSNKEIIVVDDGSKDESLASVRKFEGKGVQVLSQPNRGASAARNRAFAISKGEYVKFFDADDVLHPRLVEAQMARIDGKVTAIASASWGRFYNNDLSTFQLSHESVWRDMDARDWLIEAWMNARPMMQPAIFLIPRSLVESSGLWNEFLTLIDDFEFFARILSFASEVRFAVDVPVYYRSGVSGSLSGQRDRTAVESACNAMLLGTSHLLAARDDARARRACANLLQDFIYTYYPDHKDLLTKAARRVKKLGGSDLSPTGTRPFEQLRDIFGWKVAKRIQCAAYRFGYKPRPPFARPRTRGANAT